MVSITLSNYPDATLKLHTFTFRAMGSPCQLRLYADSYEHCQQVASLLQGEAERLEQKYSRYRSDSILSQINQHAGSTIATAIDQETAALLEYANTCYQQSDGLFDISAGVLRECWKFSTEKKAPVMPTAEQVQALTARIGWQKISYSSAHITLPSAMEIDLGGIVKEYAADCMATLAQQHKVSHGLIELGGDIRVIGPHPDQSPWLIGISHPCKPAQALASIELSEGALATSGSYERCFEIDGQLYHHILNPLTGWPVSGLTSVSVLAEHCLIAGSAATIALLKESQAPVWLEALALPWLGVDHDFSVQGSLHQP